MEKYRLRSVDEDSSKTVQVHLNKMFMINVQCSKCFWTIFSALPCVVHINNQYRKKKTENFTFEPVLFGLKRTYLFIISYDLFFNP